jgi:hypothetical protein
VKKSRNSTFFTRLDEYLLPLGRQITYAPPAFQKSQKLEGW